MKIIFSFLLLEQRKENLEVLIGSICEYREVKKRKYIHTKQNGKAFTDSKFSMHCWLQRSGSEVIQKYLNMVFFGPMSNNLRVPLKKRLNIFKVRPSNCITTFLLQLFEKTFVFFFSLNLVHGKFAWTGLDEKYFANLNDFWYSKVLIATSKLRRPKNIYIKDCKILRFNTIPILQQILTKLNLLGSMGKVIHPK